MVLCRNILRLSDPRHKIHHWHLLAAFGSEASTHLDYPRCPGSYHLLCNCLHGAYNIPMPSYRILLDAVCWCSRGTLCEGHNRSVISVKCPRLLILTAPSHHTNILSHGPQRVGRLDLGIASNLDRQRSRHEPTNQDHCHDCSSSRSSVSTNHGFTKKY